FLPLVTVFEVPFDCDVTSSFSGGNSAGLFKVLRVTCYEVERGPNGQPLSVDLVDESDGSTPLAASKGNLLEIRLVLTAGTSVAFATLVVGRRATIPRTPTSPVWNIQVPARVFVGHCPPRFSWATPFR